MRGFFGVEEVLKKAGGDAAKFDVADGGEDMVFKGGAVGADGVFAEVDFYVFGHVFGHAFGHGHAGGFGICAGLIDFGHGGAVGFFTGGFGCAADALDAFSLAGFVFDFDSIVPFFSALVAVHGRGSFLFG